MSWDALREAALAARERAYAPYSKYRVGAAIESESGQIYGGCNVENIGYSGTICAERVALGTMVASGEQRIRRVFVVTADGGTPCGVCRQVLSEFAGPDVVFRCENAAGDGEEWTMEGLLPARFDSTLVR